LEEHERHEAADRTSVRAHVIHEAIREDGETELRRPVWALVSSGLSAGLAMVFSVIGEAVLRTSLPETAWSPLITKLAYPIGFLIAILGKQQLYTENTLTPILPLMARRTVSALRQVLRLWSIVLAANLVGTCIVAWILATTNAVDVEIRQAISAMALEATGQNFGTTLLRSVFAGWLIALVVWLKAAVDSGEIAVIVIFTYLIGIASFPHIIAGAVEVFYAIFTGQIGIARATGGFLVPVLVGNTLGGVSIVAGLNHAQVIAEEPRHR
jgi:formate-nitrite transporter family protein